MSRSPALVRNELIVPGRHNERVGDPERLRRLLREQAGLDLAALREADGGQSGSTYLATGSDGTPSVLKVGPNAEFGALTQVTDALRGRGYPAPRIYASGQVEGRSFWLQEFLPGAVLNDQADPYRLLPELLRLNDAQAGAGDGGHRLSEVLAMTLTVGGDGYCVHATLDKRPDTRDLLATLRRTAGRCLDAIPERDDYVHYDFTLANLLTDGRGITGVIDLNPPPLTGDRVFDLATLLFYHYDQDDVRDRLRARALELTGDRALRVYLAHMVLRQVDWSLRHHPDGPATRHHLRLARLVERDLS
jgi:Ser/Thr protein kinase RdoA (MazF antagonist)